MPSNLNSTQAQEVYDFRQKARQTVSRIQEYSGEKEKELKIEIYKQRRILVTRNWLIVAILCLSFSALGFYSYKTIENDRSKLQLAKQQQTVAGINDGKELTAKPVTGEGFSLLIKKNPPKEFVKTTSFVDSQLWTGRKASNTIYEATVQDKSVTKKTGFQLEVLEYDNRYDLVTFADFINTNLKAEIISRDISIPKDVKLTKIQIKNSKEVYYTTATTENYYILKTYQETENSQDYQEINKYFEEILNNLYLN
jgi:hypothetical protein